jgi:hypothetical protein
VAGRRGTVTRSSVMDRVSLLSDSSLFSSDDEEADEDECSDDEESTLESQSSPLADNTERPQNEGADLCDASEDPEVVESPSLSLPDSRLDLPKSEFDALCRMVLGFLGTDSDEVSRSRERFFGSLGTLSAIR